MNGLQLLAAAVNDEPDISTWSWATVTAIGPLRIKLDGESTALNITPDTLVGGLGVGARVWVQLVTNANPARAARRVVILGAAATEFVARVLNETQNNTATLTNDGVLFFTPPATGTVWEIEIWGAYGTETANGFQCAFDVAVGNQMRWTVDAPSLADTTKPNWDYVFDGSAKSLGRFGGFNPMRIKGVYRAAASTATLHFQWAQTTGGAGPTYLLKDTFMRATQIA